jgi:hypothetical protein
MTEGFWLVRLGRLHVYDWSLEEALACALRVKRHARATRRR